MKLGNLFKRNADVSEHNLRRHQNDLATLDQGWIAKGTLIARIGSLKNIRNFSVDQVIEGGAQADQYVPMSKAVTISYETGKKASSLKMVLDMDGTFTLTRSGQIEDHGKTTTTKTTSGNKVLHTLDAWLMDVGDHYNVDMVAELQRVKDVQERAVAVNKQQERLPK